MTNSTTATVETLTAEVRVLMVGSRQVTLGVFGQLDEVEYGQIEPFGRVRPKDGSESYIYVVGRRKVSGELVRAKTPVSDEAMDWEAGFSQLEHGRLAREKDAATKAAEQCEAHADVVFARPGGGGSYTGSEEAARHRERAEQLRNAMAAMISEAERRRGPLWDRADEAETLPLIILAGLR